MVGGERPSSRSRDRDFDADLRACSRSGLDRELAIDQVGALPHGHDSNATCFGPFRFQPNPLVLDDEAKHFVGELDRDRNRLGLSMLGDVAQAFLGNVIDVARNFPLHRLGNIPAAEIGRDPRPLLKFLAILLQRSFQANVVEH